MDRAALAQHKICRQVLADELGVALEDNTTRLYQQIRDGAIIPSRLQSPAPIVTSPPGPAPLFVGRAAELARLGQMLEEALTGLIETDWGHGVIALPSAFPDPSSLKLDQTKILLLKCQLAREN